MITDLRGSRMALYQNFEREELKCSISPKTCDVKMEFLAAN